MRPFRPVWDNDFSEKIAGITVKLMTDQKKLARVAKTARTWEAHEAAVRRLTDPVVLADVVKNEGHRRVLDAARERLDELNLNSNP